MSRNPWRELLGFALLVVGTLAAPFLIAWAVMRVLPSVAALLPAAVVRTVCVGFLCTVTLVAVGFLLALLFMWVVARAVDSGHVPTEW